MKSSFFILLALLTISPLTHARTAVSIISYNVENLFSPDHDPNHNDWGFTAQSEPGKAQACRQMVVPSHRKSCLESDWNGTRLKLKLEQIRRALTQDGSSALPQVLALTEIENQTVIEMLAAHLGYKSFLVSNNTEDERGLDVAILYNESSALKLVSSESYLPDFKNLEAKYRKKGIAWESRAMLVASFEVDGKTFNLAVNHWPSQLQASAVRKLAATELSIHLAKWKKKKIPFLVLGDFNVIEKESAAMFADINLHAQDVHEMALASGQKLPLGSYFYPANEEWNLLDRIFISEDLNLKPQSYRILNNDFLSKQYQLKSGETILIPKRYDFLTDSASEAGFSDHYPLALELDFAL